REANSDSFRSKCLSAHVGQAGGLEPFSLSKLWVAAARRRLFAHYAIAERTACLLVNLLVVVPAEEFPANLVRGPRRCAAAANKSESDKRESGRSFPRGTTAAAWACFLLAAATARGDQPPADVKKLIEDYEKEIAVIQKRAEEEISKAEAAIQKKAVQDM